MATLLLIAIFIISIAYFGIIIYYRFAFVSVPINDSTLQQINPSTNKPTSQPTNQPFNHSTIQLSIIIPARNEAINISACINSILQNNYPTHLYEIIVVDDFSEDDTASIVKQYASQNVKLLQLKDYVQQQINAYKKKAIEIGVQHASGTLIITTDADCTVPNTWLQSFDQMHTQTNASFIAAPVVINNSNRFIEIFQALDFMTLQGITAAVVHKKQMTMCNGANMAYTKVGFAAVGGFAGIDTIASGDDMLLMHKMYKANPADVQYLHSQKAIVNTAPVHTISQFLNQRIRWASKADKYDDKRILPVLVVVYLFNVLLCLLPLVSIFKNFELNFFSFQLSICSLFCWLLLIKILVELFFLNPVAKFYNKQKLLLFFPIMQPFHIVYTVVAGWLGKYGSYQWKERKVK